ncbi:hypothetical protein FSARC_3570 [Fusarium sarcochroum]|uniref:Uncharacterized protein n=1 Tax=Fusarium sarcochroum TaxID=1208366 RepID=A0A8H4U3Z1_9HYPO|nr:hypothetical protein FSARC_3570 [Fusarium sarcochroum]
MSLSPMHAPVDISVGDRTVHAKDMLAVRTKGACTINIKDSNNNTITAEIPKGTPGYLIQNEGNQSFVELVKRTGEIGRCRVPTDILEIGVRNSELKIMLPRLQAANAAATISNSRAQSPAGKAILAMWEDIQKNKDLLKQHGLRTDVYDAILNDETQKRTALNAILASFTSDAWEALNTPELPVRNLYRLRKIDPNYPHLKNNEALIYLRLYTNNLQSNSFAKYVGRTIREYPHQRQLEHEEMLNNSSMPGTHYLEARKYQARHAIPIMILKSVRGEVVPMAEMTLCSLLRSWNPRVLGLTQQGLSAEALAATLPHRLLMTALGKITSDALHRVKFPSFAGTGCNWGCLLQEAKLERRQWTKYRVTAKDGRGMSVFRCHSHAALYSSGGTRVLGMQLSFLGGFKRSADGRKQWEGFVIRGKLNHLPGMRPNLPLIVSIELMEDGKPHVDPWFRHPYHGAWDNSPELHSFSVKVEWVDEATRTWYRTSIQHQKILGSIPNAPVTVTPPWRKATMILQFLHNRKYRNPPSYLQESYHPNIRQMNYDHLQQVISFSQIAETDTNPPSQVSFQHNYQELLKAIQNEWPEATIGRKPPADWFHRYGQGPKDTACIICRIGANMFASETHGCRNRQAFAVAPNEPHADMIREGSCNACWRFWRRPCLWVQLDFGRVEGEPYNHQYPKYPPAYRGIGPSYYYQPTATRIQAPISLENYCNILEDEKQEDIDNENLLSELSEGEADED